MTNMQNYNNKKFISYILLILSLFIFFFLVLSDLNKITELDEANREVSTTIETLEKDYENLNKIKEEIELENINDWINKYINSLDENKLVDYFYSYALNKDNWVKINNLSISKWNIWKTWFNEWLINLNIKVKTEENLLSLIDFLIAEDAKYKLFIENIAYPINFNKEININIPLVIFYK